MKYFTIDLEEWWGGESFKPYFQDKPLPNEDRIYDGLNDFLELLDRYEQKATFFVLGRVAVKFPELVPSLVEKGHQIGTHGYNHELVYNQSPEEFEHDLLDSLSVLSRQAGYNIVAYRAPSYSITRRSLWAIDILRKNGIVLDSSISPASNSRFGIPNAPEKPYCIETDYGPLLEYPPNIIKLGKNLPITSGFGFRLFPLWLINRSVKKFEANGTHSMFIFHNWEMDVHQPKIKAGKIPEIIHYYGVKGMQAKVGALLQKHRFDILNTELNPNEEYIINNGNLEIKV
ncbi:MAG: polysaccharide deacetylase family protein (PEP-CTERM system associated) [Algoriphagus sp.]|jgi:polysaccharide deacetylase family protein (PEP-CTERM system associated)